MQLRLGVTYRSQVCQTEVVVVRLRSGEADLTCGGYPLINRNETPVSALSPKDGLDTGSAMGKRYTDASGSLELLVTRRGAGTLAISGEAMLVKDQNRLLARD